MEQSCKEYITALAPPSSTQLNSVKLPLLQSRFRYPVLIVSVPPLAGGREPIPSLPNDSTPKNQYA